MTTETHTNAVDGVTATVTVDEGEMTVRAFTVSAPGYDMWAKKARFGGQPTWDHEMPGMKGMAALSHVIDNIPAELDGKSVRAVLYSLMDRRGHYRPNNHRKLLEQVTAGLDTLRTGYGEAEFVTLIRKCAAFEGYRLEPDDDLIRAAGGDCMAYHELKGALFDAAMSNGSVESMLLMAFGGAEIDKRIWGMNDDDGDT